MKKRLTCIAIGMALLLMTAGCGDIVLPTALPENPNKGNHADTTSVVPQPLTTDIIIEYSE